MYVHKKTFRYRIYPTPVQETKLQRTLDECRWLYDRLLEERREAYKETGKDVSLYSQINRFSSLKEERETLKIMGSQVLQNVARSGWTWRSRRSSVG